MGFVLLGLAAANAQAVGGAVLQMFSHGVIAGLLFAVVGRLVYERTHTRRLEDLRAMALHRLLPFAAVVFVIAGLASMGMPGFSGFPAELTILIGTWKASPVWALCAAGGILIAAAFTLRVIQVSFFGRANRADAMAAHSGSSHPAHSGHAHHALAPITWAEKAGALLLVAATTYVGLKPDVLLDWITPALQSPLMQAMFKGGTP
jgi:NADH-quinone oxidoreductase subunit M